MQGKSLALEPSATRTSGRPTFRVQGWSGRDYDGGPLDDFSSDPAKRSFVAVFAHAKTTLEGMECPPDLEDLVEPCLAMTVVAHVHALAAIEAVRYSETAGGAAQNVEEKVNLLCEVDTSGAVPRAWVFSRPVGGGEAVSVLENRTCQLLFGGSSEVGGLLSAVWRLLKVNGLCFYRSFGLGVRHLNPLNILLRVGVESGGL